MLNEMREKLEELDEKVFYGRVAGQEDLWNYIVFGRRDYSTNRQDSVDHYYVAIIRENFIPEGYAEKVIALMQDIPGLRVDQEQNPYNYVLKGNTSTVVEMLTLGFHKARKGR